MPELSRPRYHVVFRRQVSDGNYGSEVAEVMLDEDVPPDVEPREAVALALEHARGLVHAELMRSPSSAVRRALAPPQPRPAPVGGPSEPDDDEDLPY